MIKTNKCCPECRKELYHFSFKDIFPVFKNKVPFSYEKRTKEFEEYVLNYCGYKIYRIVVFDFTKWFCFDCFQLVEIDIRKFNVQNNNMVLLIKLYLHNLVKRRKYVVEK